MLQDWKRNVTAFFRPRQRWLTKIIPNTWADKPWLIPEILYASVIHFVEENGEDCFNVTDWPGSGLAEQEKQLREVYEWAKTGRKKFQDRINAAHPVFEPCKTDDELVTWLNADHRSQYEEVWRLEKEFDEIDKKHLHTIIDLLPHLWT
jgi:hypothetical protein